MRILLGTHQLEALAGSELFTAELAHAFREREHNVAIFTFFKGALARAIEAQGIPVFHPEDASRMSDFAPHVIQTSHLPCAHFLRAVVPEAIRVHAILGVIPNLESPPLEGDAFSLGLMISEEVADRIHRTRFAREAETAIFRNWFDERAVVTARARSRRSPMRIAVISNHIAPKLVEALAAFEAAGDVRADYFGAQRRSVPVDGALLARYDAVVSIGRTALLAAACSVPCIMADIHGSDGLLTAANLDLARTANFSGRWLRLEITKAHLQEEIEKVRSYDREELCRRIKAEYSLASRADWLLSRYQALLAESPEAGGKRLRWPAEFPPSEGLVYADLTIALRQTREELDNARQQIAALKRPSRGIAEALFSKAMVSVARRIRTGFRGVCARWHRQVAGWPLRSSVGCGDEPAN